MSLIALTKRAKASNGSNALENFAKLSCYAKKGSLLLQKQAKTKGMTFTVMREGKIYKVGQGGNEEVINIDNSHDILFKPIRIDKE